MRARCTHVEQVTEVTPRTPQGCEECLAMGGLCLIVYKSLLLQYIRVIPVRPSPH